MLISSEHLHMLYITVVCYFTTEALSPEESIFPNKGSVINALT